MIQCSFDLDRPGMVYLNISGVFDPAEARKLFPLAAKLIAEGKTRIILYIWDGAVVLPGCDPILEHLRTVVKANNAELAFIQRRPFVGLAEGILSFETVDDAATFLYE